MEEEAENRGKGASSKEAVRHGIGTREQKPRGR